jgi:hypothetical protein
LQARKLRAAKTVYEGIPGSGGGTFEGLQNLVALAKELRVSRRQLYRWRAELDREMPG